VKRYKIALIPGDGIGPDQTDATLKVLEAVQSGMGIDLEVKRLDAGDGCFQRTGVALPAETVEAIKSSDVCLKGPVGETAADVIVKLRLMFDLYANVRPIKAYPRIPCLRPDIDFLIVRENTEDVYKGIEFKLREDAAVCMRVITRKGCERIARRAFEFAKIRNRGRRVTAVHKANVMKLTCGLFAQVCREVSKLYKEISFDELYVDAAAMQLIKRPNEFDVIVTTNMFGDILSDEAAQLVGGLGMVPSGNIGDNFAIFEPVHGSAPKYAGKRVANPCSMILASSMMFNWLGEKFKDTKCIEASKKIERSVIETLRDGVLTQDLGGNARTDEVGEAVSKKLRELS
jgi:3-isopropylmalate dehydrogenase